MKLIPASIYLSFVCSLGSRRRTSYSETWEVDKSEWTVCLWPYLSTAYTKLESVWAS